MLLSETPQWLGTWQFLKMQGKIDLVIVDGRKEINSQHYNLLAGAKM